MTSVRVLLSIAALTGASLIVPTWAAAESQPQGRQHLQNVAEQAAPGKHDGSMRAGATTPGYADQMKLKNQMHEMHDKMLAAGTPDERNAVMTEQMELMRKGMNMMGVMGGMGGMGSDAGTSTSDDMSARQGMMEGRMDIMQSMMQMMMDRIQSVPATK